MNRSKCEGSQLDEQLAHAKEEEQQLAQPVSSAHDVKDEWSNGGWDPQQQGFDGCEMKWAGQANEPWF